MNYIKRFKIKTLESRFWFWVLIYEDIEKLREDAKKAYDKLDFKDTLGVSQPYERVILEEGKEEQILDNVGIIRLHLDYLGATVVSHEVLHSALWIFRLENNGNANFGKQCSKKEESLCHIYGQLYAHFLKRMYDLKFY